jgi:hypothetical protein
MSRGAIDHELVTHGDGTEAVGRRYWDERRRLIESLMTFTQSRTSAAVAPTTTAMGVWYAIAQW